MQNCLNFSVDRSMKAKHATATHTYPGPPLAPRDTVPAGHKREGENQSSSRRHCPKFRLQMDSRLRGNDNPGVSTRTVSPGPLRGAEQRRGAGGLRLALSEPQASLASRPAHRVAQGTGVAGTDPGVALNEAKKHPIPMPGKIWFVGAGPATPDLITVKGRKLLEQAGAILYAGSLVDQAATLLRARRLRNPRLEGHDARGNDRLAARAGAPPSTVVRLQTGDPGLYGALIEMTQPLTAAGIRVGGGARRFLGDGLDGGSRRNADAAGGDADGDPHPRRRAHADAAGRGSRSARRAR
jgi:hypothetical protein